jgi:hypothetical protein
MALPARHDGCNPSCWEAKRIELEASLGNLARPYLKNKLLKGAEIYLSGCTLLACEIPGFIPDTTKKKVLIPYRKLTKNRLKT